MPKEYEPLELSLPESHRKQILDNIDRLLKYPSTGKAEKPSQYKKVCQVNRVKFEGVKFDGLQCSLDVNKTTKEACIQAFMKYASNIDEKSPKQTKKIQIFQKFFFWNDEDKKNYENVRDGKEYKDFCFYAHSGARSPAPAIVKHRDVIAIGAVVFKGDSVIIAMEGADYDKEIPGVVRGKVLGNYFIFTQKSEQVHVEQFLLVDPAGSIPAWIYNTALDDRCEVIVLLKAFIEGTMKPEYD